MKNLIMLMMMLIILFATHVLNGQAMLKVQIKDGKIVKTEKVTQDKPPEVKQQKSEPVFLQTNLPKPSQPNSAGGKKILTDDFDLVVQSLILNNGGGPNIRYLVQIGNNGTSGIIPAGAVLVKSYLSTDNIITTDDFIIQHLSNSYEIGPGQSDLLSGNVTIEGLAEGQYYLGVIVDPSNTIAETNENDNVACTPEASFTIYSGDFDLVAASLDIVDCTLPTITANYRIINLGGSGTIPVNAFDIEFSIQLNGVSIIIGGLRNTEPLPPGHELVGSYNPMWPPLPDGTYYIKMRVDLLHEVADNNSSNNEITGVPAVIVLNGNYDLTIENLNVIDAIGPSIAFNYRLHNFGAIGTIPERFVIVKSYLTSTQEVNAQSCQINETLVEVPIGPGEFLDFNPTVLVSGVPDGNYYLAVVADAIGAVLETDENNNTAFTSSAVIQTGSQNNFDLAVNDITINDGVGPDLSFSFTVANLGTGGDIVAGSFFTHVFLSADATVDGSSEDYQIYYVTNPYILTPYTEFTQTVSDANLSRVPSGSYYLGVITDAMGSIAETNENNNTRVTPAASISVSANADLTVTNLIVNDAIGPDLSVTYSIANIGTSGISANSFYTSMLLSTDAIINTSGDFYIYEEVNQEPLPPGGVIMRTITAFHLDLVPNGTYYLGVIADGMNQIPETNENNNSLSTPTAQIQIGNVIDPNNFDLVVTSLNVMDADGPEIACLLEVANNGTVGTIALNSFTTKFYLSTDVTITDSDYQIYSLANPLPVGPGGGFSAIPPLTVSSVPDGNYFLGVIVDADNVISETDENNNTRTTSSAQIQIHAADADNFDLLLSDLNVTDWVGPEIRCSYKIHNNGTRGSIPMNTFSINSYLSSDAAVTTFDYLVGSYWNQSDIGPGDMLDEEPVMIASGLPDGNYYLGIFLDPTNLLTETNETNNLAITSGSVIEIGGSTDVQWDKKSIPDNFKLYQNYPNPFNPTTVIGYQLPAACVVTLKVYDVLGNEVAVLIDNYQQAGTYNYQLSTGNFQMPSGIYFYRLTAGIFSDTRKFVLLK